MNGRRSYIHKLTRLGIRALSILALVALTLPATTAVNADAASPFVGAWQAVDVDGSDIRLSIAGRPDGPFQITWTESYMSICNREAGIVRGTGQLDPDDSSVLHGQLLIECFTTGTTQNLDLTWTFHDATNTLSSSYVPGVITIWTRPGNAQPEPPQLNLRVNYGDDWVESFYEADHTIWITVTDADGGLKATAQSYTTSREEWGGESGFQTQSMDWVPARPNIQAYDWVFAWVDNGASAQVQIGHIRGKVDVYGDSITGTLLAPWFDGNLPLSVECHPWGSPDPSPIIDTSVKPDGADPYSCSWAGIWNIRPQDPVGVAYTGSDGNWVANVFKLPTFVAYKYSAVEGYEWPLGNTVTLTLNGGYTMEAISEQEPGGPEGRTRVLFELWRDGQSFQTGDHIVLTDGNYVKETVVTNLEVTDINIYTRTVSGVFDPAYSLWAWLYGSEYRVPNKIGDTWWISFDSLPPGAWGGATQWEINLDGDGTSIDWQVPVSMFVNSTADIVANDGFCTLREAIISANTNSASGDMEGECPAGLDSQADHVVLEAGQTYSLTTDSTKEDAGLDGDLDIWDDSPEKDLVIEEANGYYATISQDAGIDDRVLENLGATVELQGLTFRGGSNVNVGAGILNGGRMTLVNGQVYGNAARGVGGGIYNYGSSVLNMYGGGIFSNSADAGGGIMNEGELTLGGVSLMSNSAQHDAGGIFNQGTLTVQGGQVFGNRAEYAGGISNWGGTATLRQTTVANNAASASAGGIHNKEGGTLTVEDGSVISGNTAVWDGAGLNNWDGLIVIRNSQIVGNRALQAGGGLNNLNVGAVTVESSIFSNNAAGWGGGAVNNEGQLTVTESAFLNNSAVYNGDAVRSAVDTEYSTNVTGSCIVGNGPTAVFNYYGAIQNATGNWWGAPTGPSGAAPGLGDSVGPNIDYSGWLMAPPAFCAP